MPAGYSKNRLAIAAAAAVIVLAIVLALVPHATSLVSVGLVAISALAAIVARNEASRLRYCLARSEAEATTAARDLRFTLDAIAEGVVVVERNGNVSAINEKAIVMLDLPARFREPGQPFTGIIDYMAARGEFQVTANDLGRPQALRQDEIERVRTLVDGAENDTYERRRPDGTVLKVASKRTPGGGFVRVISDVTEHHRSAEKIERLYRQDALTSLPNRAAFAEYFKDTFAHRQPSDEFSLVIVDVDAFKLVNEAHGHATGDRLLRAIALRLTDSVRAGDFVARTAGDEFSVVLRSLGDPRIALGRARELVKTLREPYVIADHVIVTSVSAGVAICPSDGETAEELIRNADLALHNAKLEGRNTCRLFAPEHAEQIAARRRIELDLARAVLNDQLALHYQPLVNVPSRQIVGFEALLRWHHPELGMVSPAEFIPIAEETGLIAPIGRWVLRQACEEAMRWPDSLRVAVNLSATQFKTSSLVGEIKEALHTSGLPPHRLELEVTETALLHNTENTVSQLREIGAMGARIAMDDFGTGYSSLNYLREFAFDRIKIDGSFIAELGCSPEADSIVEAIVALARCLGVETTAEGVEKPDQLARLTRMGCSEVQGYLFARPRPAAQIADMLDAGTKALSRMPSAPSSLDLSADQYRLAK
jgi:diguanylate cyclase (GGDEF)-like protein